MSESLSVVRDTEPRNDSFGSRHAVEIGLVQSFFSRERSVSYSSVKLNWQPKATRSTVYHFGRCSYFYVVSACFSSFEKDMPVGEPRRDEKWG